jgi:hypothetical protein
MTDTMDIMTTHAKKKTLKHIGKCHIYKSSKDNLQMNDTNANIRNAILKALQVASSTQQHTTSTAP